MSRNRILRACGFSERGKRLLSRLEQADEENFYKIRDNEPLKEWIGEAFRLSQPILFVGAAGIAVRSIAPFVKDKQVDSPVVVMDEGGQFVIPLLSGHLGGANELAGQLATKLQAVPVITTATDVNGLFAVDDFARRNGFSLFPREGIQKVSAGLLEEGQIRVRMAPEINYDKTRLPEEIFLVKDEKEAVDVEVLGNDTDSDNDSQEDRKIEGTESDRAVLTLTFRPYVVGMGCKKGMPYTELKRFLQENLKVPLSRVAAIASIDLKKREEGLLTLATAMHLPFYTYTKEELLTVQGDEALSDFVQSVTGVSNVCEKSALYCAGEGAVLVQKKTAENGMTLAVARRLPRIATWKEDRK